MLISFTLVDHLHAINKFSTHGIINLDYVRGLIMKMPPNQKKTTIERLSVCTRLYQYNKFYWLLISVVLGIVSLLLNCFEMTGSETV